MIEKDLKDITKNTGYVFAGNIFEKFVGLIFNFIVARYLGAEIYGRFVIAFIFISFVTIILKFGFDQGLLYFIPKYREENRNEKIGEAISFTLIFTTLFSVVFSFLIFRYSFEIAGLLHSPNSEDYIRFFAFFIILNPIVTILFGAFRGIDRVKQYVISFSIVRPIIRIIVLVVLLLWGSKIYSIPIAFYVSISIPLLYLLYSLNKLSLLKFFIKDFINDYKGIIKFGIPLLFSALLAFTLGQTDVLMIGYYLKDKDVGVFNIALQLGTVSSFLLVAVSSNFATVISKLFHKKQVQEIGNLYKILTRWVLTVNLLIFSVIILFSRNIMGLFGSVFVMGSLSLVIISAGQVINSATGSCGMILAMTGFPSYEMYGNIINLFLKILLNVLLIPIMGILGAAFATALSVTFINIFKLFMVYKKHRIHPYDKQYLSLLLVTFFLIFTGYILLPVHTGLSLTIYLGIIAVFFAIAVLVLYKFTFTKLDKEIVFAVFNKLSHGYF